MWHFAPSLFICHKIPLREHLVPHMPFHNTYKGVIPQNAAQVNDVVLKQWWTDICSAAASCCGWMADSVAVGVSSSPLYNPCVISLLALSPASCQPHLALISRLFLYSSIFCMAKVYGVAQGFALLPHLSLSLFSGSSPDCLKIFWFMQLSDLSFLLFPFNLRLYLSFTPFLLCPSEYYG